MIGDGAHDAPERACRVRDAVRPLLDHAYTLARYLMREPAEAGEVVQEGFELALRQFDRRAEQAAKPWLLTLVRDLCYARLARRGPPPAGRAVREILGSPGERSTIRPLIHELPAQLREALVLCEIIGLSYQEIADVTRAPVEAVMLRLCRARALLRAGQTRSSPPRKAAPQGSRAEVLCGAD